MLQTELPHAKRSLLNLKILLLQTELSHAKGSHMLKILLLQTKLPHAKRSCTRVKLTDPVVIIWAPPGKKDHVLNSQIFLLQTELPHAKRSLLNLKILLL